MTPWRDCLERRSALNHELGDSHFGLAFKPRVYRVVARLLAEASAENRLAA